MAGCRCDFALLILGQTQVQQLVHHAMQRIDILLTHREAWAEAILPYLEPVLPLAPALPPLLNLIGLLFQ